MPNNNNVSNHRIWFITGVSSGLGRAIAEAAMDSGDLAVGTLRRQSHVDAFNAEFTGRGRAVLLDVTDHAAVDRVVSDVIHDYGRIDVVVNNAGVGFVGAIEETSTVEARRVMEVNFFGALKVTQAILPSMRQRRAGHIVQISSHGGLKAFAGFGMYNAGKFALEGFSEALAQEIAPLGIRLTLVEPGPFRTNFAGDALSEAERVIEDYAPTAGAFRGKLKSVHDKQEGDPRKAAAAIVDLARSPDPPLRLPLGATALKTIGMKVDSVRADLERGRETAERVVFG